MPEIDTKKWSVLKSLDKEFVKNIKYVYVFGINGTEVIVITNDDNIYAFGDNIDGCLGVGHTDAVTEPTLIPELSQKQITNFEFGAKNFVFAIDKKGSVYSWGNNGCGQLCNGNVISQSKPIVIEALTDKTVIAIKTGRIHSLALTSTGDVYIMGFNYSYNDQTGNYDFIGCNPIIMSITPQFNKLISISSGLYHALLLTHNGDVYHCCGSTDAKTLDIYLNKSNSIYYGNMYTSSFNWSLMQNISDAYITKIVCGPYHSLLLSNKGYVYCFGANDCGQCGDGTNEDKVSPTKVNTTLKFKDICATKNYDISVALADNGICYVWGKCGQNSISSPMTTQFNAIYDVLEFYSITKVTYKPISPSRFQRSVIMDRISAKFNKREFSDITFKVGDKNIYAQKSYLINVCKFFEKMFSDDEWAEKYKDVNEITKYSYDVFYAFIQYLYTDSVDIKSEDSLELLELANYYLDDELKSRCAKIIKDIITIDNVLSIYFSADKYNSMELKEYCIEYFSRVNIQNKCNAKIILENTLK